jgi:hypothetical protein
MTTLWLKVLRLLQKHCKHPDYAVKVDIHEGDAGDMRVQWCECCGAFRFVRRLRAVTWGTWIEGEWREPRPDWYTPSERREYRKAMAESK